MGFLDFLGDIGGAVVDVGKQALDWGSDVLSYAVDNEMLNDVITGAAIGAGVSWLIDEDPWLGAATGGGLAGLGNAFAGYDLTDYLFGSGSQQPTSTVQPNPIDMREIPGKSEDGYWTADLRSYLGDNQSFLNPTSSGTSSVPQQPEAGLLSNAIDSAKKFLVTDTGKLVTAGAVGGIGNYLAQQALLDKQKKQKEDEIRLQNELKKIEISHGWSGGGGKSAVAPWASEK